MFEFQRLSREDYELMGRSFTWTVQDVAILLTSFEMEISGAFGDSQELFLFNRRADLENIQGLEKVFHHTWGKWREFIRKALYSGDLPSGNAPKKTDAQHPPDPRAKIEIELDRCVVAPSEFLGYISEAVFDENKKFDMEAFISFLSGKGSAPARSLNARRSKIYAPAMGNGSTSKNSKKSARAKAGSDGRWSEHRETKDEIRKYAMKMDSEGCTCNHSQLAVEIHEYACDKNGNALLGDSEMSLNVVKDTVKDLFMEKSIKRVKGVDVFKDETACEIHHPDEYKYQKHKKRS